MNVPFPSRLGFACVALSLVVFPLRAERAISFGGTGADHVAAVAAGPAGDLFLAGRFEEEIAFPTDGKPLVLKSAGGSDAFLGRFTSEGKARWVLRLGGEANDEARALLVDSNGVVTVGGVFSAEARFDPDHADAVSSNAGRQDLFVARYDSNGRLLWVRTLGGSGNDDLAALAEDGAGGVWAGGTIRAPLPDSEGKKNLAWSGAGDGILWRLSSEGETLKQQTFGALGDDAITSLAAGADGSLLVGGSYSGPVGFGPLGARPLVDSAGRTDGFVAYFREGLSVAWVRSFGGRDEDSVRKVAFVKTGDTWNALVAGQFRREANLDPGPGEQPVFSRGGVDLFCLRLDSRGLLVGSAVTFGGTGDDAVGFLLPLADGRALLGGSVAGDLRAEMPLFQGAASVVPESAAVSNFTRNAEGDAWLALLGEDLQATSFQTFGAPLPERPKPGLFQPALPPRSCLLTDGIVAAKGILVAGRSFGKPLVSFGKGRTETLENKGDADGLLLFLEEDPSP